MTTVTSQFLEEARSLLHEGKYSEAFNALRPMQRLSPEDEDWGDYCLVRGEICLSTGDHDHQYPDKAICAFRRTNRNDGYAQAKFLRGWQLQLQGTHSDAIEALSEAYSAFLRVGDNSRAGRTLSRIAYIAFHQGNIASATSNLTKAIRCFEGERSASKRLKVEINLAMVLFLSGQILRALDSYSKIAKDFDHINGRNQLACLLGHALVTAISGDIPVSSDLLRKAKEIVGDFKREQAQYYEIKAWIALLDNDFATAEKALKKGLALSLKIAPESTLISQIKRLYGDLYVATKKFDLAEKFATEALEVATKLTERAEIAACHRVFAQVAQHRGNEDKARDEFKQAIDLYSQIGARYELAATRYLAGASGLYHNGERAALLYLAREYFESEDIKHYIETIDRELNRTGTPPRPRKVNPVSDSPGIIVVNPAMRKLVELAEHVAASDMSVLLTGETGTGKDLMARHIHDHSGRTGPFVPVNAAAIPSSMIESELFGHAKGAFTGAGADRIGLFEQANEGTFYLNEIADASLEFQAKLLQVLETRTVRRLGDNKERPVSFRLIAATNHNLKKAVDEQNFRLDLFHRLNEIPIHLPPLAERREDVPALVHYFLTECGLDSANNGNGPDSERLAGLLTSLPWPGNVRELKTMISRLWIESHGDMSEAVRLARQEHAVDERAELLALLEATGWNRRETGRRLGVSEGTVRRRIKKLNIESLLVD